MNDNEWKEKEKEWELERKKSAIAMCQHGYWHNDCLNYVIWHDGENREISTIHYAKDGGITMIVCMDGTTISSDFILRMYLGSAPDGTPVYSGDLAWVDGIGGRRILSIFGYRGTGYSLCDGSGLYSSLSSIVEIVGFIREHEEFFLDYLIEKLMNALNDYCLGKHRRDALNTKLRFLHEAKRLRDFDAIYGWGQYGWLSQDDRAALTMAIHNVGTMWEIRDEKAKWQKKEKAVHKKAEDILKMKECSYNMTVRKHILLNGKTVYRAFVHCDWVRNPTCGEGANPFDAMKRLAEKMKADNYGKSFINSPW